MRSASDHTAVSIGVSSGGDQARSDLEQEPASDRGGSRDLGWTLRNWVKQAERYEGKRSDGLSTDEREERARLRRENQTLRMEREILKKAAAFSPGKPASRRRELRADRGREGELPEFATSGVTTDGRSPISRCWCSRRNSEKFSNRFTGSAVEALDIANRDLGEPRSARVVTSSRRHPTGTLSLLDVGIREPHNP